MIPFNVGSFIANIPITITEHTITIDEDAKQAISVVKLSNGKIDSVNLDISEYITNPNSDDQNINMDYEGELLRLNTMLTGINRVILLLNTVIEVKSNNNEDILVELSIKEKMERDKAYIEEQINILNNI